MRPPAGSARDPGQDRGTSHLPKMGTFPRPRNPGCGGRADRPPDRSAKRFRGTYRTHSGGSSRIDLADFLPQASQAAVDLVETLLDLLPGNVERGPEADRLRAAAEQDQAL